MSDTQNQDRTERQEIASYWGDMLRQAFGLKPKHAENDMRSAEQRAADPVKPSLKP